MTQTEPLRDEGLEWIVLEDFTPGIYAEYQAASGAEPAPDGAAQLSGTVGCVGPPNGGLIAAPRVVNSYTESLFDSSGAHPTNESRMAILGFRNVSPIRGATVSNPQAGTEIISIDGVDDTYPDFLVVATQTFVDTAGGSSYAQVSRHVGYRFNRTPIQSSVILAAQTSGSILLGSDIWYGTMSIALGRTAAPGQVQTAGVASMAVACAINSTRASLSATTAKLRSFPSFLFFSGNHADGTQYALGGGGVDHLLAHQDRLIGIIGPKTGRTLAYGMGALTKVARGDYIAATSPNDWGTIQFGVSAPFTVFVGENPSGLGCWASMNASELIAIRNTGGGFAARGDLANPTIVRLPGLPSVHNAHHEPIVTPDGLVYGNPFGVWVWAGGDTAERISPQLDGWFWKAHAIWDQIVGPKGSFGYMEPFVFAPNNFLYDRRTKSWWRFGNPTKRTYAWYSPSANGNMLCGPAYIDATQTTLVDWFSVTRGCHTFTWVGHPLRKTLYRLLEFRRINLFAQGGGTVTITITGINGTTRTETFTIDSSAQPKLFTLPTQITAQDAYVTITSTATATSGTAPRIDRVLLGHLPRQRTANSS